MKELDAAGADAAPHAVVEDDIAWAVVEEAVVIER